MKTALILLFIAAAAAAQTDRPDRIDRELRNLSTQQAGILEELAAIRQSVKDLDHYALNPAATGDRIAKLELFMEAHDREAAVLAAASKARWDRFDTWMRVAFGLLVTFLANEVHKRLAERRALALAKQTFTSIQENTELTRENTELTKQTRNQAARAFDEANNVNHKLMDLGIQIRDAKPPKQSGGYT